MTDRPRPTIPSLSGKIDPEAARTIRELDARTLTLEKAVGVTAKHVTSLAQAPPSLSFDQIRSGLEINGEAALDITGLRGITGDPQTPYIAFLDALPPVQTTPLGTAVAFNGVLYGLKGPNEPGQWVPLGALGTVLVDTHANRLVNYLPANYPVGSMFWESDRTALYRIAVVSNVNAWVLMLSRPFVAATGSRPADLGVNDNGFLFTDSTLGQVVERWVNPNWTWHQGTLDGVHASRPATNINVGFRYRETDRGYQTWVSNGSAFVLEEGVGGPMRGTLDPVDERPIDLGANDVGFQFQGTGALLSFLFRWDGAAWVRIFNSPPMRCLVYTSVNITFANGGPPTVIFWDSEQIDSQGLHTAGGTRITVPTPFGGGSPSIWEFKAQVEWDTAAAGYRELAIAKNGGIVAWVFAPANTLDQTVQQVVYSAYDVADGDYFEVYVQQSSGGNLNVLAGVANSWFAGHRVW